ncbi:hypothetical protein NX059_011995 [Plenodomus lindquistii]|nr:hypothetical protein NX059_011995 [Plenodomus lindquistii]
MVLNFVKATLMFYIAFQIWEDPLVTMGDAVATFLKQEDIFTKDMCLASFGDLERQKDYGSGSKPWSNHAYRWRDVTSKLRRATTLTLFLVSLVIVGGLLGWAISSSSIGSNVTTVGFGAVDPRTAVVGMPSDPIVNAVVSNLAQLVLSLLYFSYNALFTAMLMGYEWTTFALKSKGLRVSSCPTGAQRSTYFLQLPYRFGIPLMILSVALHWLVSQSIFLIKIDYYDSFDNPTVVMDNGGGTKPDYTTLGYSPSAMIAVLVLGSLTAISIVAIGNIPYKQGIPLAGSNSMAISAACHPGEDGTEAAVGKLRWGVVGVSEDGVGHCAFSTKEVTAPVEGTMYM